MPDPEKSVLQEAEELINGPRHLDYGDPHISFENYAKAWSIILGVPVSAMQVALCMMMLKIIRENNHHKRDNLADIAGYAGLAEWIMKPSSHQGLPVTEYTESPPRPHDPSIEMRTG